MKDLFLERDAVISECGRYRYLLRRTWDHGKPRALIVMLNPSTADAEIDDATIRSCIRLTNEMGYGSFEVVNIFGLRSTDPAALATADDPIGPLNERVVAAAIMRCDVVICAWGAHPMAARKKRPNIDAAGLAQINRKERLLRDVIRSGGRDVWSHLFSHGHKHPTVRLCIREGYLTQTSAYHYEITDAGRRCVADLEHARWTGTAV